MTGHRCYSNGNGRCAVCGGTEPPPWPVCTGAETCTHVPHVHGCYADTGQCDAPDQHPVSEVTA